jgi:hypothetical protein
MADAVNMEGAKEAKKEGGKAVNGEVKGEEEAEKPKKPMTPFMFYM